MVHYSSSASYMIFPQNANPGQWGWGSCCPKEWLWALRSSWLCSSLHCSQDDIRQTTQQVLASFLSTRRKKRWERRKGKKERGGREEEKAGHKNCCLYCDTSWYDSFGFSLSSKEAPTEGPLLFKKLTLKSMDLESSWLRFIFLSSPQTD